MKVDEEELSELQLRLLALQSASKKWQQKEQQVLRRSKDRITKPAPEKTAGSGAAAAAAAEGQRQRVTTRSASKAAATAASSDRSRTRSKTGERERDRTKTPVRPADRERAKPAARGPADRGRTPGKASVAKKTSSPGERGDSPPAAPLPRPPRRSLDVTVLLLRFCHPVRLGSQAGGQEAAAEDVEAAAAAGAGGEAAAGGGGATQAGGGDPPHPRPVQPGRAVQPLHEAGGRQGPAARQGEEGGAARGEALWL